MARTLPPVQAIRAEIDALFAEGRDLVEVIEDVARLIIQTAVEAEADAFLGRARYQRAVTVTADRRQRRGEHGAAGYRDGHCPTTVKTTSGPITIAGPSRAEVVQDAQAVLVMVKPRQPPRHDPARPRRRRRRDHGCLRRRPWSRWRWSNC
ncbi:hypothetical protein GCM10020220_024540 [Nonomuraea rubra]